MRARCAQRRIRASRTSYAKRTREHVMFKTLSTFPRCRHASQRVQDRKRDQGRTADPKGSKKCSRRASFACDLLHCAFKLTSAHLYSQLESICVSRNEEKRIERSKEESDARNKLLFSQNYSTLISAEPKRSFVPA
ncbi:hypothetical protein Tcan_10289 [Toxocara canis]|uniref:Uncharacterized protein n=1 Tax=Toxocara canis TaxID=6265 RepID=A0A0B2UI24_TOXCA|nr:hypothetical protein Tcan_10289 [Toxocara canis]